jgi:hypothetical protein
MSVADGFSPGAARPIQPAYPDYQNRRATEEALAAMAAPTPSTANPINPNIPSQQHNLLGLVEMMQQPIYCKILLPPDPTLD